MENDAITIREVHKTYGKKPVLQGLNLTVTPGSIYAFLGRNGEGKTTTMKLLLNILNTDAGSLSVLGMDVRRFPEKIKERIGFVPESPFFYEWMTVSEILAFVRECYKDRWDAARASEMIGWLQIPLAARFSSLSMGMKAKVALVAALGHRPEVLLLDDPTSGLDAVIRREFLEVLVELVSSTTCTVFFSTHLISDVERVADHVGLLKHGKLEFQKNIDDLKNSTKKFLMHFHERPEESRLNEFRNVALQHRFDGKELTLVLKDLTPVTIETLKLQPDCDTTVIDMDLEEIFISYTKEQV